MKYIKLFEELKNSDLFILKNHICTFLENIKLETSREFRMAVDRSYYDRFDKHNLNSLALRATYGYTKFGRTDDQLLTVKINNVQDKKQKENSTKFKITFDFCYDSNRDTAARRSTKDFMDGLLYFTTIIFNKYKYYVKKNPYPENKQLTYFINSSDIQNIIQDLTKENFEFIVNAKKYNL